LSTALNLSAALPPACRIRSYRLVARGSGTDGEELVQRVLAAVESVPFRAGGETIPLTASIGWAPFPLSSATLEGALDLADHALYQANTKGRNRAVRAPV
jgi:GGDEF domain-containing protein